MKITRPFLIIFCLFLLLGGKAAAQQNLFYSHYFLNPFLYNPSFVAPNGYSEMYLNYRKQWSGIEGAPTTGTVSIHLPLSYKAGFAVSGFQDQAGVLKTTTGLLTFAYHVYLGKTMDDVHKLSFGMSAGMTSSSIDPDQQDDVSDPVVGATSSFDGQFGMHYQLKNLKLAFAIPRLFQTYVASDEGFTKPGIDQIKSTISSISYNFKLNHRLSFEPMATYRTYENTAAQYEGLGVLRIDNIGWIGGSYRQDYGASGFVGFNIKEKLKIGYAYEFATDQINAFGDGTHEVQLVLRLGKKKLTKPEPVKREEKTEEPMEEPAVEEVSTSVVVENEIEIADTKVDMPESKQPALTPEPLPKGDQIVSEKVVKSLNGNGLPPGHYVVVGAFHSVENAKNYTHTLKRTGYPAAVAFHPEKGYYIVHMTNAPTMDEAREARDKYRQMSRYSFRDTWILTIE